MTADPAASVDGSGVVAPEVPFDVLVVGSANLDLVATAPRHPAPGETVLGTSYHEHPGGKGLNQAVAAGRARARTAFVGAVGDDGAGRHLLDVLSADHVDASAVRAVPDVPTGRAVIVVDHAGENSIVVVPGANAWLGTERARLPSQLPRARVLLVQLEIPLETVARAITDARAGGAVTVLNPAPAANVSHEVLAMCDIVVPNEHEVDLLGGASRLLDVGVGAVVITRGARGADVITPTSTVTVPPFPVDPVDTTGAGDAFCGWLAARLATGDPLADAVRWATAAGALATTARGAVPSLPSAVSVERLVSGAAPPPPTPRA